MKKLTLTLISLSFAILSYAQYTLTDDDVVVTNGIIESCSYDFAIKDIVIPETLDGQTVTGIGNNSYYLFKDKGIKSVQLPSTLKIIGSEAFFANNLTTITIPKSVTTIGDWAFCMNNLTSVSFESNSNIGGIGKYALYSNPGFSGITLPTHANPDFINYTDGTGKTYSPGDAITDFRTNYYIDIPYTLTDDDVVVSSGVIESCSYDFALKVLIIPETLDGQIITGIADKVSDTYGVFATKVLAKVTLPSTLEYIGDFVFSRNSLTNVIIPNNVNSVGSHTFFDNSLTSVTIPNSVTYINRHAFHANNLTEVTIPNSVISIGSSAFAENKLSYITIPNSVTTINDHAFYANDLNNIVFETNSNIRLIGEYAFFGWPSVLSSITLPTNTNPGFIDYKDSNGITYSPGDAITDFTINYYANIEEIQPVIEVTAGNLKTILGEQLSTITNLSLKGTIDARDFKTMRDDMPLLAEVDLSGVNIVEYSGTEGTSLYGFASYPANAIPAQAFVNNEWKGKSTLKTFQFPITATIISNSAFYGCSGLSTVSLPYGLQTLASQAFVYCRSLTSINIPSTVKTIGTWALGNCNSLTSVNIPASVISMDNNVFGGSLKLTDIIVHEDNTNYSSEDGVLFNKTKSTLIQCPGGKTGVYIVPATVTSINDVAFVSCVYLESVLLPINLTNIGSYAFSGCSNLNSITVSRSLPVNLSTSINVFYGINKTTCILYVPYGSKAAYKTATQWQDFENIVELSGLVLSATSINLGYAEGSSGTIDISSNTNWSANSDQPWLTVNPTSGINNGILTLTATLNLNTTTRMATISVSPDGAESQTIIVIQGINNSPVANAGNDQFVANGELVTLDGSTSFDIDEDPINYQWTAPNHIKLSSENVAQPTFTAPKGGNSTQLSFSLVVNDGTFDSQPDEVIVNIVDVNNPPEVICNNISVYLDENGTYLLNQNDLENLVAGTTDDNNSFNKLLIDAEPNAFSCDDVGLDILINATVTDLDGASSSCTATISVIDQTGPLFGKGSKSDRVTIPSGETYTLPDYSILFPSTDNCGSIIYTQSPVQGTTYSSSTVENISLIATDKFGNSTEAIIKLSLTVKNLKSGEILTFEENTIEPEIKVYPNPFTEQLNFEFQFVKAGKAKLELFDLRGVKISTLFNMDVEEKQLYKMQYKPINVAPGMLFYRLIIDDEVINGKVIFNKQK